MGRRDVLAKRSSFGYKARGGDVSPSNESGNEGTSRWVNGEKQVHIRKLSGVT